MPWEHTDLLHVIGHRLPFEPSLSGIAAQYQRISKSSLFHLSQTSPTQQHHSGECLS